MLNDKSSDVNLHFKNLGLTNRQKIKLMDHYGVLILSDMICKGNNKPCTSKTLGTLDKYSATLELFYGHNGRNLQLNDGDEVKQLLKTRMIVREGFSGLDGTLKALKKKAIGSDFPLNIDSSRVAVVIAYLISSMSDVGEATDSVLEGYGNIERGA